jgi:hypothetical protein
MKTLTATFDDRHSAEQALEGLLASGVHRDAVSLLLSEEARVREYGPDGPRVSEGASVGGAMGGLTGALIGGLVAVGSIVVPGAGLLAAGPLVAALAGAGAGGAAGSFIGALAALGLNEGEATKSAEAIANGKIFVAAFVEDDAAEGAARILRGEGGHHLQAEAH